MFIMHVNTNHLPKTPLHSQEDSLLSHLLSYGVNASSWKDSATKLRYLCDQISTGELELLEIEGRLFRATQSAVVAINGNSPSGTPLTLALDHGTFANGSSFHNVSPWSVIERLTPHEDPAIGAMRGLERTLSISAPSLTYKKTIHQVMGSDEFTGLPAVEILHEFSIDMGLQSEQKGYIARTDSTTTFFEWRPREGDLLERAVTVYSLSPHTIKEEIAKVAWEVHSVLLHATKRREFGGLISAEVGTAGGVTAALTSFDGSSSYVKGGLATGAVGFSTMLRSSSNWLPSFTTDLEQKVDTFAESHSLGHVLPVTTTILPNLPYGFEYGIKIGELQKQFFMPIPSTLPNTSLSTSFTTSPSATPAEATQSEMIEQARLVGTLLTLELMKEVVSNEWPMAPTGTPSPSLLSSDLTPLIEEVHTANKTAWESLQEILSARRNTLVLGESFTGGKLREYCARSLHGKMDPSVSTFYLWYDPMWKVAAGVPAECVTDDRITSTETAQLGAKGLLRSIDTRGNISLATTGWANRRPEQGADQFSVAIASRCFDSKLTSRSMYVEVTSTSDVSPSYFKRAFTRELGVSAALNLLADQLGETYEPTVHAETFQRLLRAKSKLEELLKRHTLSKVTG